MIPTIQRGFTMLELILVIIILGIVSSIGAEIIANVYEGYIIQRAQHRASLKTELAATQIANRLAYAIPGTVVRKNHLNIGGTDITELGNNDDNVLQWVGADMDSFNASVPNATGTFLPAWSGFCDLNASTTTSISTPGSNLSLIDTIRGNLSLTVTPNIYFPSELNGLVRTSVNPLINPQTITLAAATPKLVEHYKLASSSYALVAEDDGDLWLYYNIIPEKAVAVVGTATLLLRNVTTFRFRGDGRTIRFKICVEESIGDGVINVCKEKAVF